MLYNELFLQSESSEHEKNNTWQMQEVVDLISYFQVVRFV